MPKFGLTPKSKRGLAASEAVEAHQAARCVVTDWRRINRLRSRCFRFQKCKNHSSEKSRNTTHRMFRTTTMIRAPPVCALTAQIASICISNVELWVT